MGDEIGKGKTTPIELASQQSVVSVDNCTVVVSDITAFYCSASSNTYR